MDYNTCTECRYVEKVWLNHGQERKFICRVKNDVLVKFSGCPEFESWEGK